mmetsp:Transcript_95569/g.270573  ORF Transcript_95569/g.270573 Transcript_95569/m.270573 type:complete len:179 (-) Transcript_95569:85-621(-)
MIPTVARFQLTILFAALLIGTPVGAVLQCDDHESMLQTSVHVLKGIDLDEDPMNSYTSFFQRFSKVEVASMVNDYGPSWMVAGYSARNAAAVLMLGFTIAFVTFIKLSGHKAEVKARAASDQEILENALMEAMKKHKASLQDVDTDTDSDTYPDSASSDTDTDSDSMYDVQCNALNTP